MNAKHKKTYDLVFAEPMPRSLPFRNVEAMLLALGCASEEGSGSRVAFNLRGEVVAVHRPHPGKEIKLYQIKEIRGFLVRTGARP